MEEISRLEAELKFKDKEVSEFTQELFSIKQQKNQ